MTLKDFYDSIGGSYDDVIRRLFDEEIIYEFLLRFAREPVFEKLQAAMEAGNQKEAFTLIHTFKGTCANMGLGRLYSSSVELTEALRAEFSSGAPILFKKVEADYYSVIKGIHSLQDTKL
ncbi:MAG: Hpt domain-containing protein [Lachnospiraceae bacterium]|nr:Hpt domain-containing protein [Lachnospiraceae bacterium]